LNVSVADDVAPADRAEGVVYLVEEQANPSSDYFVMPALTAAGTQVVRCGFADLPARAALQGATVLFVRYVPAGWARLVAAARRDLSGLVFFMDDDVLDVAASAGMPWRYRLKLARLGAWRRNWLRRQKAELWVSTRRLAEKYAASQPRLVEPQPLAAPAGICRLFYHGSASHGAEIRWLRPVVAEVLRRDERVVFEIIGGREVWRLYRDLPRVTVVHPMKWPAYQAFAAMPGRDIGLAPLLDLPFNRARSCTKFFDITRSGAVGVYSPGSACDGRVRDGIDGMVVPLQHQDWVEAILALAADAELRKRMFAAACARHTEMHVAAAGRGADSPRPSKAR
jgi:glycosyltransferase involved in cell wall biosynthesis